MNPNLTALDQVRMWSDGRMAMNEIVPLLRELGYEQADLNAAWITLLDEGYTQRTSNVKETRLHIPSGEMHELPMTHYFLVPPA